MNHPISAGFGANIANSAKPPQTERAFEALEQTLSGLVARADLIHNDLLAMRDRVLGEPPTGPASGADPTVDWAGSTLSRFTRLLATLHIRLDQISGLKDELGNAI